jgi:hypothetical protein
MVDSTASIVAKIGVTDASHAANSIIVVDIAPVSTPVEVVSPGSVQDAAVSGISSDPLHLSEESITRVGEFVTLGPLSLSEVPITRAD